MATSSRKSPSDLLAHFIGSTPNLSNVTGTTLMLVICAVTLGTLNPQVSGSLGPAITGFMTAIGTGLFANMVDRLRARHDRGEAITQADLDAILKDIHASGLDSQLRDEAFQREMRTELARLDVLADLVARVPQQTVEPIIEAMSAQYDLLTVSMVKGFGDVIRQSDAHYADLAARLDVLQAIVKEAQGKRTTVLETKPPARHVFISYAHADGEDLARLIYDGLRADGTPAWLDRYDILPGQEWDTTIQQAIEDCKLLLFVVTQGSVASEVCKNEWTTALSTQRTVVPAIWQDAQIPMRLNGKQWIDFRGDFGQAMAQLRATIRSLDVPPLPPQQVAEQEQRAMTLALTPRPQPPGGPRLVLASPLPQDVSGRFKDRSGEQAQIVTRLMDDTRLICIYGRAGVGKTALACKVLGDLVRATDGWRPDGILPLWETRREATDTGLSVDGIFSGFGKLLSGVAKETVEAAWRDPQRSVGQKVTALLSALGGGRYVLLLDNLETLQDPDTHLLADRDMLAFFEAALRQGGLRVLVTSRYPLAWPHDDRRDLRELKTWERIVPLEEGLPPKDAAELLRALDGDGKAGLRDAPADKLNLLAERTRGFPRALEAVAGLLLEDETRSLDDLLADPILLANEVTTVIVQQAIARLSPNLQKVMEALALFGRPVRQEALEYLLAPYLDTSRLHDQLLRLLKSHFVSFNRATASYSLHPIDMEYCFMRVPEDSSSDVPESGVSLEVVELMTKLGTDVPQTEGVEPPPYTRHALLARAAVFFHRLHKKLCITHICLRMKDRPGIDNILKTHPATPEDFDAWFAVCASA